MKTKTTQMSIFDIFKKKGKKTDTNSLDALVSQIFSAAFPNGNGEALQLARKIETLLSKRYSDNEIFNTLSYAASLYITASDKSSKRIVGGILRRKANTLSYDDAMVLYKELVRHEFANQTGITAETPFKAFYKSLGNDLNVRMYGYSRILGAYGEYGYSTSNPIPVRGVPASYHYLDSLKDSDGNKIKYNRTGTFSSPVTDEIIDGYDIFSIRGNKIGTIYICPYVDNDASYAPKGLFNDVVIKDSEAGLKPYRQVQIMELSGIPNNASQY